MRVFYLQGEEQANSLACVRDSKGLACRPNRGPQDVDESLLLRQTLKNPQMRVFYLQGEEQANSLACVGRDNTSLNMQHQPPPKRRQRLLNSFQLGRVANIQQAIYARRHQMQFAGERSAFFARLHHLVV
jgi:hypothetical protein